MSLNIQSTYTFAFAAPMIDSEEKEIMKKLLAYGVTPTGNKSADKAKLRQIEEKKAKEENIVSGKFLTVSRGEEEKIQERKKERRDNMDVSKIKQKKERQLGADILGQQIYLAIKMKDEKKKKESA
ncbi:MAG: hypothetical protein NC200_06445 [Candidatus Gastranaerophilales bacterium]|nr:hypothetical protein [Candidatus Gastranaerophilales bacterium]